MYYLILFFRLNGEVVDVVQDMPLTDAVTCVQTGTRMVNERHESDPTIMDMVRCRRAYRIVIR